MSWDSQLFSLQSACSIWQDVIIKLIKHFKMFTSASDIPLLWQQANGPYKQFLLHKWEGVFEREESKLSCAITAGSCDA